MIQSIFLLSPTGEVLIERHFRGVTPRSVCDYFWEKASVSLNHHGGLSTTTSGGIGSSGIGGGGGVGGMVPVPMIGDKDIIGGGSGGGGGGGGGAGSFMIGSDPLPLYDTVPPIMEITIDDNDDITEDTHGSGVSAGGGTGGGTGGESKSNSNSNGTGTGSRVVYLFSILRDGLSYIAITHGEISPLLILEFLHRVADIFVEYFGSPADESAIKDNFSTVYQLLEETLDNGWPLTTEPNALQAMIRPPTVMGKVRVFVCV